MSKRNPEYDFKWCPGCGDFGVKVAIEQALAKRAVERQEPVENTVVVAGIGCSGNLVHLQEGPQPFGLHGIHGRTLPIAWGLKSSRPDLNILIVSGDGDFLSIGAEHIGPQARRNLDVTVVVMDNELDPVLGELPGWYSDRHPNLAGYNVIADETAKYLAKLLREKKNN